MVTVCFNNSPQLSFDDNSLVKFHGMTCGDLENWGDEDCHKMVTNAFDCDIHIDKSIADQFIRRTERGNDGYKTIWFLRYDYYHPAFHLMLDEGDLSVEKQEDGSIVYHLRMK